MNTKVPFKPKRFVNLEEAVAAIGDRRRIDYLPTINGRRDPCSRFAYVASDLSFALKERGFGKHPEDHVLIWLPEPEVNMLAMDAMARALDPNPSIWD